MFFGDGSSADMLYDVQQMTQQLEALQVRLVAMHVWCREPEASSQHSAHSAPST